MSEAIEKYPRDLLQRFVSSSSSGAVNDDDSDEVELNLGLSLGGRFGVDKSEKKLTRSSSIAGSISPAAAAAAAETVAYPALMRTSSLPVETEEQWRKRKELQSLRRMEAKRRRSEKQRNLKADREGGGGGGGGGLDEERGEIDGPVEMNLRDKQHFATANMFNSMAAPPFGLPSWAAAARQASVGGGGFGQPSSQGSMESRGGCSSGISDLESRSAQGLSSCGEARSPGSSTQSLQEQSNNQEGAGSSGTTNANKNACRSSKAGMEDSSKKPDYPTDNKGREIGINAMEDMPCVFTKGDGPNGRRVDGILYKYGKGEEVRIMCVCHGSFLSPADFVKHAGGREVAHPLRHIVINPSASTSLL